MSDCQEVIGMNLDAEFDASSPNLRIRFKVNASSEALTIRDRLKLELNLSSRYIYESVLIYLHSGLYKDTSKDYCKTNIISDDNLSFSFYCPSLMEGNKIVSFLRSIKRSEQRKLVMNALYYRVFILDKNSFSLDGGVTNSNREIKNDLVQKQSSSNNTNSVNASVDDEKIKSEIPNEIDQAVLSDDVNSEVKPEVNIESDLDDLKNNDSQPEVRKLDIPILF